MIGELDMSWKLKCYERLPRAWGRLRVKESVGGGVKKTFLNENTVVGSDFSGRNKNYTIVYSIVYSVQYTNSVQYTLLSS